MSLYGRKEETVTVYPADVVLFEGILMFYAQDIRDLFQMKLFVDTDADTRLSRRGGTYKHNWINPFTFLENSPKCLNYYFEKVTFPWSPSPLVLRDISERGRDLESILAQYITFVKPAFEEFCLPVSAYSTCNTTQSSLHGRVPECGLMVKTCFSSYQRYLDEEIRRCDHTKRSW